MNSQFTRANKCINYFMQNKHRTPDEVLEFKTAFAHTDYVPLHKSFNPVIINNFSLEILQL